MVKIRRATNTEIGALKGQVWYMVERDGTIVGRITKHRNTTNDVYPWNVYALGNPIALQRFYDDADSVKIGPSFDYETCRIGGKTAAFVYARRHFSELKIPLAV